MDETLINEQNCSRACFSIEKNYDLQTIAQNYFKKTINLTAIEVCAIIEVLVLRRQINDIAIFDAKTTHLDRGVELKDAEFYKQAYAVFDCGNNAHAQLLEKCLVTTGIWASKGSGDQSDEGSKYVYLISKTEDEKKLQRSIGNLADKICYFPYGMGNALGLYLK